MNNFKKIKFIDFYFNGRWLSDFEGEVASTSSDLFPFSLLPEKEITTVSALGRDGELVVDVKYNPRTWIVPVVFSNLSRIREIAGWLGTRKSQNFYFKGDNVKIQCVIDSSLDINRLFATTGNIELKFISHSTYYKAINDILHVFKSPFPTTINFHNQGNIESYPIVKVIGSGDITITINDVSFTVKSVSGHAYVDMFTKTCYQDNATNKYHHFTGKFPTLNSDYNTLRVSGTGCTGVEIQCNSRWI